MAKEGDTILMVIPQDIAAPKGRLILPQVQTLRELLDKVRCFMRDGGQNGCCINRLGETSRADNYRFASFPLVYSKSLRRAS